jgi:tryptophan halogenase
MAKHLDPKAPRSAVERIVIVGGGTSGWLSAAFLSHMCGPDMLGRFDITLVESQDIGNIGVGEATIPTLRQTLQKVGLTESDFFRHCNASFKLGIKFVDWHRKTGDGAEDVFWNPFGTLPTAWSIPAMNFWLASFPGESPEHFTDLFTAHTALAKAMKAPKAADSKDFDGLVAYAYHMDTHLFGRLLRERAMERGVKRILDKVVAVERDDRGWIERLRLQEGQALSADLFIDCSGFRSLLLQQGLEEPFHSFDDSLLCDSAIAISQPWPEHRAAMRPYTTATAMDHGWAWNIPLYSREASGYVYSAKHTDAEQAEREFRRLIGDEEGRNPALHIEMKTGRVDHFWKNNCLAIGLSGGFIEPLESTGIYMVEMGLRELEQYFPDKVMSPHLQQLYNRHMRFIYDQTKDFIGYHYCMSEREDTAFWRDNKHGLKISDDLRFLLDLWRTKVPSATDFTPRVFSQDHYSFLMVGHRAWPKVRPPVFDLMNPEDGPRLAEIIGRRKREILPKAIDQLAWLRSVHSGESRLAG